MAVQMNECSACEQNAMLVHVISRLLDDAVTEKGSDQNIAKEKNIVPEQNIHRPRVRRLSRATFVSLRHLGK